MAKAEVASAAAASSGGDALASRPLILCEVASTLNGALDGTVRLYASYLEWTDDEAAFPSLTLQLGQIDETKADAAAAKLRLTMKNGSMYTLTMSEYHYFENPEAWARSFEQRDQLRDKMQAQLDALGTALAGTSIAAAMPLGSAAPVGDPMVEGAGLLATPAEEGGDVAMAERPEDEEEVMVMVCGVPKPISEVTEDDQVEMTAEEHLQSAECAPPAPPAPPPEGRTHHTTH